MDLILSVTVNDRLNVVLVSQKTDFRLIEMSTETGRVPFMESVKWP